MTTQEYQKVKQPEEEECTTPLSDATPPGEVIDDTKPLSIPKPLDPPSIIRKYIRNILHLKHELPLEKAEGIASKWQIGLGYEFLGLSVDQYNDIFGNEFGERLFHYQKLAEAEKLEQERLTEKRKKEDKDDAIAFAMLAFLGIAFATLTFGWIGFVLSVGGILLLTTIIQRNRAPTVPNSTS